MLSFMKYLCLLVGISLLVGCGRTAAPQQQWLEFHANGPNQGSFHVDTVVPSTPTWKLNREVLADRIYSSPVIGSDGTIYIGTIIEPRENVWDIPQSQLVAVNPDGNIKWTFPLLSKGEVILSAPAVGQDGNIYFISIMYGEGEGEFTSKLYSVDPNRNRRWVYQFKAGNFTTASPKTWGTAEGVVVFVYVTDSVLVIDSNGQLVEERNLTPYGTNTWCGNGPDIVGFLEDFWTYLLPPWVEFDKSGIPDKYLSFLIEPTIAIVDIETEEILHPVIVAAGKQALVAFQWDGQSLIDFWSYEYGEDCGPEDTKHMTSPAVFANGLLIVGTKDKHVLAFDIQNGELLWEFSTAEAVIASPVSVGSGIYIVSTDHIYLLDGNGNLLREAPLLGQTLASPALSSTYIHVNSMNGLKTFTLDLNLLSTLADIGGSSSPAIAADGSLYIATFGGDLIAYRGP